MDKIDLTEKVLYSRSLRQTSYLRFWRQGKIYFGQPEHFIW